jgi:fructose-bisphosphate aldolase class II
LLTRVKCTGASVVFDDKGDKIPGTSNIVFLTNRPIGRGGFTSVMFDGSRLPLDENIAQTAAVVALAHAAGASCEGEIGFVGYASGEASQGTDPDQAARFAAETGIDAMAISIGNVHLQTQHSAGLDLARLKAIQSLTTTPLVIHGGSGVPPAQRADLAAHTHICKFNIGTELRQVFGQSLRATLKAHPDRFDRIEILRETEAPLTAATRAVIQSTGASGRASV